MSAPDNLSLAPDFYFLRNYYKSLKILTFFCVLIFVNPLVKIRILCYNFNVSGSHFAARSSISDIWRYSQWMEPVFSKQ